MISGDVVTTVKAYLADIIANVVMLLPLVRACLADVIANFVAVVVATFV